MSEEKIENNKYTPIYASSNDNYISKIRNMFNKIIEQNKNNNIIKLALFNIQNFDSKSLFQEIDTEQKEYINSLDLINYLKNYSNNYNEQIIRRLIQQYDKHSKFRLIYEDFNAMIKPFNKSQKEEKNNKTLEKNQLFQNILKNEFQLILMINDMILNIKHYENFITYEAFISISNNEKNIDKNLMKSFLEDKYDENDINFLMHYLDTNNDGFITYDDFEDFFVTLDIKQNDISNNASNNKNEILNNFKNKENKMNIIINEEVNNKIKKENNNSDKDKCANNNKKEEEEEEHFYNNKINYQLKNYNLDIKENKNNFYKIIYNSNIINNYKKENNIQEKRELQKKQYKDKDIMKSLII